MPNYYIYSYRNGLYFAINRSGYAGESWQAGRYTAEEAADIVFGALPGQLVAVDVAIAPHFASDVAARLEMWRKF